MTTSIAIEDLGSPAGDSLSYKGKPVGTTYKGKIVHLDEWSGETDGRERSCIIISLEQEGGEVGKLWIDQGKQIMTALRDAVASSGATKLELGAMLAVEYAEEREVGKPQPQKIYRAQYKAPAADAPDASAPDTSATADLL